MHKCQGCARAGADPAAREGRSGAENVTCGARRAARAGPIPRTRCSSSSEPNPPCAARSSTMRWARAGPMPGSHVSSAASARSMSTSAVGAAPGAARPEEPRVGPDATALPAFRILPCPPETIADSTAAICRANASRSVAGASLGRRDLPPRTARPSAATDATKSRARRSEGVGTANGTTRAPARPHRRYACDITGPAAPPSPRRRRPAACAATPYPPYPQACGASRIRGQ